MWLRTKVFTTALLALAFTGISEDTARVLASAEQAKTTVSGSVVDGSLNPVAGATVVVERAGQVVAKAVTGADGKFRFADLAPGDYQVRAERAGLPSVTRALRVPAGATMPAPSSTRPT